MNPKRRQLVPYRTTRADGETTASLTHPIAARPVADMTNVSPQSKSQPRGRPGRGRSPLRMSHRSEAAPRSDDAPQWMFPDGVRKKASDRLGEAGTAVGESASELTSTAATSAVRTGG